MTPRRPWTPAEDAYLREHYVIDGAAACSAALGRTFPSVTKRARVLNELRRRRWTWRDDNRLRGLWGAISVHQIARDMGRTPVAIYWRAQLLGLGVGCPQGMEYISAAAERTGYSLASLRRVLRWARVRIDRAATRPDYARKTRRGHITWIVDPGDVDNAIARWHLTETLAGAAERRGISSELLVRLLSEAKARGDKRVPPQPGGKRHWRVPTALVDELFAEYARMETVASAAARVRVTAPTLAGWLRAAGVPYSKKDGVDPVEVDRVVAEKRSVGCHAWRARKAA